jgi:type IV secretion system protein TrbI
MSDPVPFDEHAKSLKSAKPRAVTRINRKVLIACAGLGALGLYAASSLALAPPTAIAKNADRDIAITPNARPPEALTRLPANYGEIPPGTPILRRPLPGDMGAMMLAAEAEAGGDYQAAFAEDFRPDPAADAERARKLANAARTQTLADSAASAPVFFRLQGEGAAGSGAPNGDAVRRSDSASRTTGERPMSRASAASEIYNPFDVEDPVSPYQVMAGTLIPASLITGLNSDLPGTITAQVSAPVYDTVTGTHLLIPQGSRLIGRYASDVAFGQDRALVTWDRILFPDGSSIRISEPGTDAEGYTGLIGRTDNHWGEVFAAAGLATLLGIGAEAGTDDDSDLARAIQRGAGDTINEAGQRAVDRSLAVKPTLRIAPGTTLRVLVTRDLVLRPH